MGIHPAAPNEAPSDEALLAGMAGGDEAAGLAFVRRYQRRVYGLARSMLADERLAEDVAQEALLRVWRHAAIFDTRRGTVSTWVLTITRNLAIDSLRVRRAVPVDPEELLVLAGTSGDRPLEEAVRDDERARLRAALLTLPIDQRRAVVLAVYYGRTASEVAVSESIPLGTAKSRIRLGLARLREVTIARELT